MLLSVHMVPGDWTWLFLYNSISRRVLFLLNYSNFFNDFIYFFMLCDKLLRSDHLHYSSQKQFFLDECYFFFPLLKLLRWKHRLSRIILYPELQAVSENPKSAVVPLGVTLPSESPFKLNKCVLTGTIDKSTRIYCRLMTYSTVPKLWCLHLRLYNVAVPLQSSRWCSKLFTTWQTAQHAV